MKTISEAENQWLNILKEELQVEMDKAPSVVSSHDEKHIQRVWENVRKLAIEIECDWEIMIAAVYLHDIGRHYPEGVREHGPISAPYAEKVLQRINFPSAKIETAVESIRYHDASFPASKRPSIEAKILFDADKFDAFGHIGISRYLIFNSLRGKDIDEIIEYALSSIPKKFEMLELDETKKLAEPLVKYAVDYFQNLKKNLE